jgi:ABC-type multidrug transport system fused ATPase/permease subunit
MKYVWSIAKEYRWQLLLIYFYMLVAQLLILAEPYVIGKMIDGLIAKHFYWMFCYIGIAAFESFFIYRRMVYDTKVYTRIYNTLVMRYLKKSQDADPSVRIARTEMSNNIINFLENDVHYYIYSIVTVVGTLMFIFFENPLTGFVVLSCVAPICTIVWIFYKKIAQSTRVGNTQSEDKASIMSEGDMDRINTFFERRRKIAISGSTLQGKNWTALHGTRWIFLVIALVVFTGSVGGISQGQAVAMYSYINQFLISLLSIPIGVETFTRIKDIIRRIKD